ncbi:MAG: CotH kinase family protein [Gemmataceae bacterium]
MGRPRSWLSVYAFVFMTFSALAAYGFDEPKPAAKKGDAAKSDVFESQKVVQVLITLSASEFTAMQPRQVPGQNPFGGFGAPQPAKPMEDTDPKRETHRNTFGFDLPWAKGNVTVDGKAFEGVGIRYKGNGTIFDSMRTVKKSFKIDLDHFGGESRFQSYKTLNLHCDVTDPSRFRETMGYALYRAAGVPASRTTFAEVRLTVPGKFDNQLLGMYTLVEQINKPFLKTHFQDDKGLLMKPEGLRDFMFMGDNWEAYKKNYVPKRDATPTESKRIIAFAKLVQSGSDAEFQKEIGQYLDLDNYLRFLATTAFVSNSDSFFALGHNFYLYLNPQTNKIVFLPWDLDRSFANFGIFGSADQQMNLSFNHPYAGSHRLTERILAIKEMATKYQALLKELAAGPFAKDRLMKELNTLTKNNAELLVRDAEAAKARKEDAGGFGPPGGMFGKPPEMDTFMVKRTASLLAQIDGKDKGFVPQFGGPGGFGMGFGGGPGGPGGPGGGPNNPVAKALFDALDKDKKGSVSEAEFIAGMTRLFREWDTNRNGKLEQKELEDAIRKMGPTFGPGQGFGPPPGMGGPPGGPGGGGGRGPGPGPGPGGPGGTPAGAGGGRGPGGERP